VLTVLEVCALDPTTEQAIWQWLVGIDLIATVRAWRGPVPPPLHLMVTEPRRLTATVTDGLWLRILDLPAALEARAYPAAGRVVMDVTDSFCPWNAGRWQLSIDGGSAVGSASVTAVTDATPPDLSLDIGDIAALYLGAYRVSDLVRAGRVRECRPGGLAAADALFATAAAPTNSTMF
jgi:predicted acetyltransferase